MRVRLPLGGVAAHRGNGGGYVHANLSYRVLGLAPARRHRVRCFGVQRLLDGLRNCFCLRRGVNFGTRYLNAVGGAHRLCWRDLGARRGSRISSSSDGLGCAMRRVGRVDESLRPFTASW
jgi:hypothetical protein